MGRKAGMGPAPVAKALVSPQSVERKLSVKNFNHVAGGAASASPSNEQQKRGSFKMTEGEDLIEAKKLTLPPISHKSGQIVPAELALPTDANLPIGKTQSTGDGASSSKDIETVKDNLEGPKVEEEDDDDEGPADPFD